MPEQARPIADEQVEPEPPDLDRFASYEDGDELVVCDRKNPRAWIKSDTVARIGR